MMIAVPWEGLGTAMLDRLTTLFEPTPRTAEGWRVRLDRPVVSPRAQAAFEAWLEADPDHLAEYQRLKAVLREVDGLKAEFVGELAAIPRRSAPRRATRSWPVIAVPALGALAAVVMALALWPGLSPFGPRDPLAGAETFTTAVGEIRQVTLADGSSVTLDTATTLRARIEGGSRRVSLDDGAAYFDVRHDAARPFQIALADRSVVVTGTRFATTLRDGEARVDLLEGGVAVSETGASTAALTLSPGDAVTYRPGGALRREARIDPAQAAAWRERRLVFRDVALSDALAEVSRYTTVEMVVVDPALGRRRVSAVFPLEGPDPLIQRVDRLLPVSIRPAGPGRAEVRAD